MDTKDFSLFINLAETLHFGQTGEALHMSASAVSRHIKRIEDELGQRLLERDNRSVSLTEAGQQFLLYARQSLSQWQAFNEGLKQEDENLSGEVSVYCSVTAAYAVLSEILEIFRRRYPDIEIKLHTGDQADAMQRVLDGQEDIAIAARPDKLSSRLQFQTLTHSPLLFIYPGIHCAVEGLVREHRDSSSPLNWNELPFVISERGLARTRLDQWFRNQSIKPSIYAQVSGHEAIVSMVALGLGVGVVPELVLANSPLKEKIQVLDVQPPLTPFAVGVCSMSQRLSNPLVKAFWDCAGASYPASF
jgi:LysR family positive regulator for ilvC